MKLVIVGNPACRRVACWQQALQRRGWPSARIVAPADMLTGRVRLADCRTPDSTLRLESIAEDWQTMKLLLKQGIAPARDEGYPARDEAEIDGLMQERGWVVAPRQCYLGFVRLLHACRIDLEASGAAALNHPDDIGVLFDKPCCQNRLTQAGIATPAATGPARTYLEIRSRYGRGARVMVKLAHGSGAAGCVALHWSQGHTRALTTVVERIVSGRRRWYCSKKLQLLTDEVEIAGLVDRLCIERVQVEEWLPKARWEGRNCDLRVVTIGGVPRHAVARLSSSPFTNLTLGNRRGDLNGIRTELGAESWEQLRETCCRVARVFPRSHSLGIDVLFRPDWRRHAVLEVNAFGELLPGVLDRGEDTYTAMITAWERQMLVAS